METMQNNTPTEGKKELYNPFVPVTVDPQVTAMKKSPEDRMYIVLYYNTEYEEFKHAIFYGRYNVYFGIKNILDSESIDLSASTVLVETVALDPSTKSPKRYLIHPDNASNIIDFCKQMEVYFGENAYSLEEYDTSERIAPEGEKYDIVLSSDPNSGAHIGNEYMPISSDSSNYTLYFGGGGGNIGSGGNGNFDPDTASYMPADLFLDKDGIKAGGKMFYNPATLDGTVEGKEI